ncbi:centrin-1 [Histomonas meleagridis]|uniref:centrin-1 n=1 Tax=Histomonas meleagridis TaxID=135588 RepID=UPI0035599DD8|nr:centrin-1 [Histomonas meleagridis]KAH0798299.1 centrin-1 [Histomonas meleagridis]
MEQQKNEKELTEQQKKEAKDAFDLFDTTGTGKMDQKELKIALMTLGFDISKENIRKILSETDLKNPGSITFNEFLQIIQSQLPYRDAHKELEEAFKIFDVDNTGKITFKNLKEVLTSMGEQITDQEILEIIAEADKTGDGTISLEEFIDLIKDGAIF